MTARRRAGSTDSTSAIRSPTAAVVMTASCVWTASGGVAIGTIGGQSAQQRTPLGALTFRGGAVDLLLVQSEQLEADRGVSEPRGGLHLLEAGVGSRSTGQVDGGAPLGVDGRPRRRDLIQAVGDRQRTDLTAPQRAGPVVGSALSLGDQVLRSEEHTSELQSLMRISYAVFCL